MVRPVKYDYSSRPFTNFQRFSDDYFAGSDVRIYFEDIWIDEITSLQFTLQENVAPIYGYASFTHDEVAIGSRQIQGSFTINFKESYYLHSITNSLESKMKGAKEKGVERFSPDLMKQGVTAEHLIANVQKTNSSDFEKIAFEFEKSLWGDSSDTNMTARTNDRSKNSYFTPKVGRENLARKGFNIAILYGPYSQTYTGTKDGAPSVTAHTLTGVHLTGVSQVIGSNGQPIQEQYTFIAKDMDASMQL